MQKWLIVLFIILPIAELWGIIQMGRWIGGVSTLALLIVAVLLGVYLIKFYGRRSWHEVQRQMQAGQAPGFAMLDGLCVLAGGILLIVPGFLSDLVGLTLLIPFTRPLYRKIMYRLLERMMNRGTFYIRRG